MTWFKNINLYFNELRTPSAFYCIFENSKASQVLNKHKSITLFDKKIELRSKPLDFSDINWLYATMRKEIHYCRALFYYVIAINAAFWIFIAIFCSFTSWKLKFTYEKSIPGIECSSVLEQYGDSIV